MIIGVGIDLAEIGRIERGIERHGQRFLARLFTEDERAYCDARPRPAAHYAARFAAKEACAKALGSGIARGLRWTDIAVTRDAAGQPTLELSGLARELAGSLGVASIHLSLTHERTHTAAVVLLES